MSTGYRPTGQGDPATTKPPSSGSGVTPDVKIDLSSCGPYGPLRPFFREAYRVHIYNPTAEKFTPTEHYAWTFDEAFRLARRACEHDPWTLKGAVIPVTMIRLAGVWCHYKPVKIEGPEPAPKGEPHDRR